MAVRTLLVMTERRALKEGQQQTSGRWQKHSFLLRRPPSGYTGRSPPHPGFPMGKRKPLSLAQSRGSREQRTRRRTAAWGHHCSHCHGGVQTRAGPAREEGGKGSCEVVAGGVGGGTKAGP